MDDLNFDVRELRGTEELALTENLNRLVWGEDDLPDDKDLLRAIQDEGGLVAGAFAPDGTLAAYLFAFPTRDPRVQHSHKLGVHPDYRRYGLALKLKWFQRDWCLARGMTMVRWTYDPLRIINAHLNIYKLCATSNTYKENYYGVMPGINAGTPSDRIVAEWYLNEARVIRRIQGSVTTPPKTVPANLVVDEKPVVLYLEQGPNVTIQIPRDFAGLLTTNLPLANQWRDHSREIFGHYFARGYRLTDFLRHTSSYVLEHQPMPRLEANRIEPGEMLV
jgi:chorismate synthase